MRETSSVMSQFSTIYERALERKGGEENLMALMPSGIKTIKQLNTVPDDRYLAGISKAVFKAGFVWRVIDSKWTGFEKAFWKFNVRRCAAMSPDDIDTLCHDESIVRNLKKIQAVQVNAVMLLEFAEEYGSFGKMIAEWPEDDFIGLLSLLNKRGDRLGCQTCQNFFRFAGKDGFVLSRDVVAALIGAGVVDKNPTSKSAMKKVQQAFSEWREESELGFAQISRILALSIDS